MTRYFFDISDGDNIAPDEEGMELPHLRAAQEEAARSLADMVRDNFSSEASSQLAVQVRDCYGPVVEAKFVWKPRPRTH
jgi:hypothetical protein